MFKFASKMWEKMLVSALIFDAFVIGSILYKKGRSDAIEEMGKEKEGEEA